MEKTAEMRLGVVLRCAPGVTRWQREVWTVAGVIPHAPEAADAVLRDAGGVREIHAATLRVELHRKETETLVQNLQARVPSVWVGLRGASGRPEVAAVTVSPFEAGCYDVDDEDRVERVAMPPEVRAWVEAFVARHHSAEPFVKRRRDKHREGARQDGIGDARIAQGADVWRVPTTMKRR